MTESSIIHLGGYTWALFPWLGTRSFRTLRRYLQKNAGSFKLTGMEFEGCYYMAFKLEGGRGDEMMRMISEQIRRDGIDLDSLISPGESPVFEKYDEFIPSELLRKAYRADKLRADEIIGRVDNRE